MNPQLLLSALRARYGLFLLALLATVCAATAASLVLPKTYRAGVSMLVAEARPMGGFIAPQERMAFMQTQADIVASDAVAHAVSAALKLDADTDPRKGLKVESSQSNVIHLNYDAADPALAAARVNAFAQAYIDATQTLRSDFSHHSETLLDAKLATLRADLHQAQEELTSYRRTHGIVSVDGGADLENARLAELSSQLVRAQEQMLDAQGRQRQARRSGQALERLPQVQANAQVQRLGAELQQSETRQQDMAQQYGPNHPAYQRIVAENRSRRAALDAEMRKVAAGLDGAAEQSRQHVAELQAAVAAQRARLQDMQESQGEHAQLVRRLDTLQKTYDAAVQRFVVDVAQQRVDQAQVSLLNRAVTPQEPYRPKLALNVGASVVIGALLGLALVVALEMLDRRVRTPQDLLLLSAPSPLPLLGVVSRWTPTTRVLPGGRLRGLPDVMSDDWR